MLSRGDPDRPRFETHSGSRGVKVKIVHVVGRRNHGKTLLITELVRELTLRGLEVATAKHCGHAHELDTPGKDSFLHRTSGATMAAVITPAMCAVYKPHAPTDDVYARLRDWAGDAAILLVEGDIDGPGKKVEVWREKIGGPPLALGRDDISAVITDDPASLEVPIWPRQNIDVLATRILCQPLPSTVADTLSLNCPY